MNRSLPVVAVLAATVLGVTACSSSEQPAEAIPQTGPGTDLAVGEPAVLSLPFVTGGPSPVEFTVADVRRGTPSDLDGLDLGGVGEGAVPWYVDVTVRRLSGDGGVPAGTLESRLDVAVTEGAPLLTGVPADDLDACQGADPPDPFGSGDSYSSCVLVLIAEGAELSSVAYGPVGTPFEDDPVVWTV